MNTILRRCSYVLLLNTLCVSYSFALDWSGMNWLVSDGWRNGGLYMAITKCLAGR